MFDVFYIGKRPNLFVHEREARDIEHARRQCRTRYFWVTSYLADYTDWNWLWEPPPWQADQCHAWPSQWQRNSGTMLVPRDPHIGINYRDDKIVRMRPTTAHWSIPEYIDGLSVDTSWHPDFDEIPWIYHFASQHQRSSGVTYSCAGAAGIKFVDDMQVRSIEQKKYWHVPKWINANSIDYSWHPDSLEPAMIYHFSTTQDWKNVGGPEYRVPGADRLCYSNEVVAETQGDSECWFIPDWIDASSIDMTWCPHPSDPPLIYEFPVEWQWNRVGGPQYRVPGADNIKYANTFEARTCAGPHMQILDNVAEDDPVRRWRPCPADPPYIYVFGNQWWPAEKRASAEYHVPGAQEHKYMTAPRVHRLPDSTNNRFRVLVEAEFDWSWEPDPGDPPYIYVFGNQWWSAEKMPTVEYAVPGAVEHKFMAEPKAILGINPADHWHALEDCEWDSSWRPDPGDPPYIYVFGNQWWSAEIWPTLEYRVPGATERKYVNHPRARLPADDSHWWVPEGIDLQSVDTSWRPDPGSPPYIYEFGTQWQKTGGAQYIMPGAEEVKYASAFRCKKVSHDPHWNMPGDLANIIEDFDWTWHPDSTEEPYIYEFGSQHQKTGGPEYHVPGAVQRKYVDQVRVEVRQSRARSVIIDHMDGNSRTVHEQLIRKVAVIKTVRYVNSYLDTLRRIAQQIDDEWIWIVSSVCDYRGFDFTWYPEQWQATMLHVFASDDLKFGDTFFMHVPTFRERAGRAKLLEWYDVNFVVNSVPRRPVPVIQHDLDSHIDLVKPEAFTAPVVLFATNDNTVDRLPAVNLWRPEVKTITPLDPAASAVLIPRDAASVVRKQLYDYPYIDKKHMLTTPAQLQDVIFISYDEPDADRNWELLQQQCPRARRLHGVNGMELALEAAADMCQTPWYYAVFAKTRLESSFDFSFVPDYLQQPKHYMFDCKNSMNGLQYGHMGVIMYNCQGIRDINRSGEWGLDYTLSFAHESVPILSCHGDFNTTPYHTWRTAFRECAKLAYFESQDPSVDGAYRLRIWQTKAQGKHQDWCLRGANDGVEFFQDCGGDLQILKKSFRWEWLREWFVDRYGEIG